MAFNTALSGVNAASKHLDVIGNNIANVSSNGFKRFRAEFGDLFVSDPFGNSKTAAGQGVLTDIVRQNFAAGSFDFTERSLDFAIKGSGFLVTQPNLETRQYNYTRDGAFGVDRDGFIINSTGEYLMAFPVNDDGTVSSVSLASAQPVQLPTSGSPPRATSEVDMSFNLPSDATEIDTTAPTYAFDPDDPETYTNATSVTIYDSLGEEHTMTTYFTKQLPDPVGPPVIPPNSWEMRVYIDGNEQTADTDGDPATPDIGDNIINLTFDADGLLSDVNGSGPPGAGVTTLPVALNEYALANGANPLTATINIATSTTQFNASFTVNEIVQDGRTVGRLSGLSTNEEGLVQAEFTNGESEPLGKIVLADFQNTQGLKPIGSNAWQETLDSGEPIIGEAGTGRFGSVQAGALETSNVNLTNELVALITAQRDFDANARSIDVENQVSDTIINIR